MVSSTRCLRSSFDEMLAGIAIARPAPCVALIAAATAAHASGLRDEITTFAPCSAMRSAMALPMPRDEPVMTATLPASENKEDIGFSGGGEWQARRPMKRRRVVAGTYQRP